MPEEAVCKNGDVVTKLQAQLTAEKQADDILTDIRKGILRAIPDKFDAMWVQLQQAPGGERFDSEAHFNRVVRVSMAITLINALASSNGISLEELVTKLRD